MAQVEDFIYFYLFLTRVKNCIMACNIDPREYKLFKPCMVIRRNIWHDKFVEKRYVILFLLLSILIITRAYHCYSQFILIKS